MVFYRKYRPQTIAELDSEEIRNKLYSVFSDPPNAPHAFLFTGPKGLGKTSAARIVAKVVNCQGRSKIKDQKLKTQIKNKKLETKETENSIEPCNECDQCVSITNGTNLDILEIDAASNRGIDEIRDLREKIRLAPVSAFKKVYIIDEVHMLTTEAFNALLKTLEEPPKHVIFILCTTEPQKVPGTIISRCSHIPFKLATEQELLSSFKRIAASEVLDVDPEALSYIAGLSDGSFRDGVKILDELVSVSNSENKKITKELIEEKYQISNIRYQISKLLEYLEKRDTKSSLELISGLIQQGIDMKHFLEKLVEELHLIILSKVGVEDLRLDPSGRRTNFEVLDLKKLMELFTKAYGELKYAVLPQLPLELAVIEWTQKDVSSDSNAQGPVKSFPPTFATPRSFSSPRQDSQNNIWEKLIKEVKTHNYSIAGILRGCSLKEYNDKSLIIETAYKFHKERLEDKKAMEILSDAIKKIAGQDVEVKVLLKEK